ncbi:DUF2459 domain-containing protein [Methylobacterium haplocladii]|uniref:DUF2459 domain-containing protein n=1 Tax=Methylobacterium haplocladii TaxID=1176176 RepID=A0A512IJV0_9HYPH|nr:DUF2459 domain-containing protein [Methylobacterium haplocladii]GEO97954.1 hypothetical protein MHA02_03420 [Methylobacterium haplocladii]GJD86001.1 hypothetical protein HPGCJGGD_3896 [Methylobacterium haplocladii]GLS61013.1 hypothetical protein GCM10007887_37060 [Methylobacterium haplocladii]
MRWLRRIGLTAAGLFLAFLLAAVLTARPGDLTLYPPTDADARTIHLVSHGWHSGVVLPRAALTEEGAGTALRAIAIRFRDYDNIEFGWGEARFYRATPTVTDVDWVLAAKALFTPGGADGVVQVVGLPDDLRATFPNAEIVSIRVSPAGLGRLLARLDANFRLEGLQPIEDGPGLYGPSLFYAGTGRFSFANVCNHWTAGLLNAAGLPVAPVIDTYPRGLILDLSWRSGATALPPR